MTLIESTSPNALLDGLARRRPPLRRDAGQELLERDARRRSPRTRERIREIPGLDVLDERLAGRESVAAWDPLRLSIDVRGTGATRSQDRRADARARRHQPRALLRERHRRRVRDRASTPSPRPRAAGRGACATRSRRSTSPSRGASAARSPSRRRGGRSSCSPRDAFLGAQEVVPFDEAEGRIAAESLAAYPPGVPNVLPGERLTARDARLHRRLARPRGPGPRGERPQPCRRSGWCASGRMADAGSPRSPRPASAASAPSPAGRTATELDGR